MISVSSVLKILGVSTSGYYSKLKRKPSKQKVRKEFLKKEITKVYHESNQIYGAPKIAQLLRANKHVLSTKTVSNYMKELCIKAIWVTPYKRTTIDPSFSTDLQNILERKFNPSRPNAVWVTDITYIYTLSGFVYLTSVMDLYSRKIIGWHLSSDLSTEGVLIAIKKAQRSRDVTNPVIIHSDRGSQYVSKDYIEATPAHSYIRSYSKKATPWDNACIESFHSLIKREWLNRYVIHDIKQAQALVFEFIETFYNTKRIHSHCGMTSPVVYENNYKNKII